MNVLLADSVLVPVLMAGPPLAACCWLLWRSLDPSRWAAVAQAKGWLRRHRTGVSVGSAAVVSAVIAAVLGSDLWRPDDDLVEVLVVRQDLPIDTLLDESAMRSHIGRVRVRRVRIPADAVYDEQMVLGKWTTRTIRAGQYLTNTNVGYPCCTMSVPLDLCQYTIELGPDNLSEDTFKAGARVDLFVDVRVGGDRVRSEPVVKGLMVLAVGKAAPIISVAFAFTRAEAKAVCAAEYRGDLRAVRVGGAE